MQDRKDQSRESKTGGAINKQGDSSKTQSQQQDWTKPFWKDVDLDINEGEENFHPKGDRRENPMEQEREGGSKQTDKNDFNNLKDNSKKQREG
jgi:hypothetical protein